MVANILSLHPTVYSVTGRLGGNGIDAGTSGAEYFDAFESRRANYIGGSAPGKAGLHAVVVAEPFARPK